MNVLPPLFFFCKSSTASNRSLLRHPRLILPANIVHWSFLVHLFLRGFVQVVMDSTPDTLHFSRNLYFQVLSQPTTDTGETLQFLQLQALQTPLCLLKTSVCRVPRLCYEVVLRFLSYFACFRSLARAAVLTFRSFVCTSSLVAFTFIPRSTSCLCLASLLSSVTVRFLLCVFHACELSCDGTLPLSLARTP
jgi:hypothetical protein